MNRLATTMEGSMRKTIGINLALALGAATAASSANASDVLKKIDAEVDPVAPASASYETTNDGVTTQKWGANVDFNMGGIISTGPELWVGNFTMKGPDASSNATYRRQDLYPGESQRLDAIRLRWNFTAWELPMSMRGWYMKAGYSYTRINSKANKILQQDGQGDAMPANLPGAPADNTELVTDIRHGVMAGFGNRWLFSSDQRWSVTLGASVTSNFKRELYADGKDSNGLKDYNEVINSLPDTRMSTRPTPEVNMSMGCAF
jgi:hypothetical protein